MPEVTRDPSRAADVLAGGGLVALPTETVYGLAAVAGDPAAVGRVFAVKGRPTDHPLIVHLPSADHLEAWAREVPPAAQDLAGAFWPGPLTLVLQARSDVPGEVTGGRETVALRVPAHPLCLEVLTLLGDAVAAPSANRFGAVSPTRAEHVVADLGDAVELVLDGGPCDVGVESTVLDLTCGPPELLRPGGVSPEQIGEVTGSVPSRADHVPSQGPARAPGMLALHYSPEARVAVVDDPAEVRFAVVELGRAGVSPVAVLAPSSLGAGVGEVDVEGVDIVELEPAGDTEGFAHVLYDRLRQVDRLGLQAVVVVAPSEKGLGLAVRDRLQRAAHEI